MSEASVLTPVTSQTATPSEMRSRRRLLQVGMIGLALALLIGLAISYAMLLHSGAAGPKKTDFVPYFRLGIR
jgi:uncharacterized membrane protein